MYHGTRRIILRDLNVQNLLVDSRDHLIIVDLGVAILLKQGQRTIQPSEILGTPNYLSPEALEGYAGTYGNVGRGGGEGGVLGLESDVWSAAACVVHMASGKKPFDGLIVTDILLRVCQQVFGCLCVAQWLGGSVALCFCVCGSVLLCRSFACSLASSLACGYLCVWL